MGLNGFIFKKINKNYYVKEKKKSWEPFRIFLLNSTANPAQFGWKWAGLAVLFSRQLLNGSHDLLHIFSIIFIYLSKYKTIETHARAFLALIISTVGSVYLQVSSLTANIWVSRITAICGSSAIEPMQSYFDHYRL